MNWSLHTGTHFQDSYKAEGVLFLLDDEDTVNFYEESGKSHQSSSSAPVQRELEALSSLDRVVRTEMVHGKDTGTGSEFKVDLLYIYISRL